MKKVTIRNLRKKAINFDESKNIDLSRKRTCKVNRKKQDD